MNFKVVYFENISLEFLLNFHPDKYHVLTLGKLQNIKHALSYRLGDKELEYAFNEKYLGVVINSPKLQLLNVQSYFDNYK